MRYQHLVWAQEGDQLLRDQLEDRFLAQVLQRHAVDAGSIFRDVTLRVDEVMELPVGRQVIDQL